jgi:hypothetical protein
VVPEPRKLFDDSAGEVQEITSRVQEAGEVTSKVQEAGKSTENQRRQLKGAAFYKDNLCFGPYTDKMHAMQDLLSSSRVVTLHVFASGAEYLPEALAIVVSSLHNQQALDPRLQWWPNGKINPQAGMQISIPDRPKDFKLSKRYTFQDKIEYYTLLYHNLIHELESIETGVYYPNVARLARFPGGSTRVYYTELDITLNALFRVGARIDVKIEPNGTEKDDWLAHVIEPQPWTPAGRFSCLLFRRRLGPSFVKEPVIAVDQKTLISVLDNLSPAELHNAMDAMSGVAVQVREHVPQIGIKRQINTLNHLYMNEVEFTQEMKCLLANNMLGLPTVDYFEELVTSFGAEAVDRERKRMEGALGPEQRQIIGALRHMRAGILLVKRNSTSPNMAIHSVRIHQRVQYTPTCS